MQENIQSQALLLYKITFILGTSSFVLATIASLSILDPADSYYFFAILIRIFACFQGFTELLELIAAPIPMWRTRLCVMSVSGYVVYLVGADDEQQFNIGEWYLMAILITSIAT